MAVLLLVLFSWILTFAIPCTGILFFVVLSSGCFFSAAFFAMDVIFGALFAWAMFCVVVTFVVAHVSILPLLEITSHSNTIRATSVPETVPGDGMRNGLIVWG